MIEEKEAQLKSRLYEARHNVFFNEHRKDGTQPILLSDSLLDEFSLGSIPIKDRIPNSHLSLLAIVDSWNHLGIRPYQLRVCETPLYRLWLGIAEYIFVNQDLLDQAIHAALYRKEFRGDDLSVCIHLRVLPSTFCSFSLLYKDGHNALNPVI